ncbi:MAG: S24/S26 family peptidase [Acidobacteriia bacterium]|nr:S24/S26 family peptidase [Terriglobia bacterium]
MTEFQNAAPDPAHLLKCELAREVLRSSGTLRLRVTGWSMLPTVMPGDTLIVDRAGGGVSRGDIVLFARDQRLFAHRVVSTSASDQNFIITQGDGMPRPDPPVAASELLGRVSFIVRNGRYIEPGSKLGVSGRAVAELVRRFDSAARILVGVHGMRERVAEELGVSPIA